MPHPAEAKTVFYAVLNMGLGHAARSLPLLREFAARGWRVLVGSNGRAQQFLRRELPQATFITTPDYRIRYTRSRWLWPRLLVQFPSLLRGIARERRLCKWVVQQYAPDVILSDHCYGMYDPQVPSFFLSHQIYFHLPGLLSGLEPWVAQFNFYFHRRYRGVIIPDLPDTDGGLLSGRLSRLPRRKERYRYVGLLSSISRMDMAEDVDLFISVSGPEPQRTVLEQRVLDQVEALPGKKAVALGRSESTAVVKQSDDLVVYAHLPRREMAALMNRSRMIVSRPGYSTLMELAELGKPALFIPTPGQTEQQYLARRAQEKGWFHFVNQSALNLRRDLEEAKKYPGLPRLPGTPQTVEKIFRALEQATAEKRIPWTNATNG